jgi:hypothetical protein
MPEKEAVTSKTSHHISIYTRNPSLVSLPFGGGCSL